VVDDPVLDFERNKKAATMRAADEEFSPAVNQIPLN
jgi:hypothetical protein